MWLISRSPSPPANVQMTKSVSLSDRNCFRQFVNQKLVTFLHAFRFKLFQRPRDRALGTQKLNASLLRFGSYQKFPLYAWSLSENTRSFVCFTCCQQLLLPNFLPSNKFNFFFFLSFFFLLSFFFFLIPIKWRTSNSESDFTCDSIKFAHGAVYEALNMKYLFVYMSVSLSIQLYLYLFQRR